MEPLFGPLIGDWEIRASHQADQQYALSASCGDEALGKSFWSPLFYSREWAMLIVSVIGCLTNAVNIAVFTRKGMRTNTNLILTALAVTDFLVVSRLLLENSLHFHRVSQGHQKRSYGRAVERWIQEIFFLLFHTWSIYLTLIISLWRFVGLLNPLQSRSRCTSKAAKIGIILALTFGTLLIPLVKGIGIKIICTPLPLKNNSQLNYNPASTMETTVSNDEVHDDAGVIYKLEQSRVWRKIALWTFAIFIKILPCALMTVFSVGLIISLKRAGKSRKKLQNFESGGGGGDSKMRIKISMSQDKNSSLTVDETGGMSSGDDERSPPPPPDCPDEEEPLNRTTKMLLVILFLFLLTEFPFGIFMIVVNFLDLDDQCLLPLLAFLNMSEYLSSSASFFIYLIMSHNYRRALKEICGDLLAGGSAVLAKVGSFFRTFSLQSKWPTKSL